MTSPRPRIFSWPVVFLAFFIITLLLAGWTICDGPIVDDNPLLFSAQINSISDLVNLLSPDMNTYWRPAAKLTVAPMAALFGHATWPHRLFALLLHAIAATLVFILAEQLLSRRVATVAGLIFLLFPLHAGNLHWISARPDLVATVFVLAGLICFNAGLRPGRRSRLLYAAFIFAGAYLAKEISFIAPLLCAVTGWVTVEGARKEKIRRLAPALLAPLLPLALLLFLRISVMGTIGGPGTLSRPLPGVILGNLIFHLPWAFLLPLNQEAAPTYLNWLVTLAKFGFGVFLFVLFWRQRKDARTWAGVLFVLIAALPIASFVYLGRSLESGYMLYLPSVGFALLVSRLLVPALSTSPKQFFTFAIAILAVVYVVVLEVNLAAYHRASTTAEKIVTQARPHIEKADASILLLENLPDRVDGIHLFYDHVDQLFLPHPWAAAKTMMRVGPNFWRTEGKDFSWPGRAGDHEIASLIWRDGEYELSYVVHLSWLLRADFPDDRFKSSFNGELPPNAESAEGGTTWRRGPITLRLTMPADRYAPNTVELIFALRTLDPRAAKEAALDWTDQNGESHRVLFTVNDDGETHDYHLALAVDPRWARTNELKALSLHLPFVAGKIRFTE